MDLLNGLLLKYKKYLYLVTDNRIARFIDKENEIMYMTPLFLILAQDSSVREAKTRGQHSHKLGLQYGDTFWAWYTV